MASSSPVASETGTVASFSLVGTDLADGEDYMVLDLPTTEAAPAEVEMEPESDPNITKETLAHQLKEMEKVMSELGLEPKPDVGVAASGAKAPSGFVRATGQDSTETLRTLEKETVTIKVDHSTSTFSIEGWESLLPALPESAVKLARNITHGELNSLLNAFRSSAWTAPLVAKILEVFYIAKREAAHNEMLKVRHTSQRGGSIMNLNEEDPGTSPQLVCAECNAPWGKFSKCLLCKGSSSVDLSASPLSVLEVEGQTWELRITETGPTWVPENTMTKATGYVEVGDLGRPPPAAASGADTGLVSFSEQVPSSQRLTLRQQVETFGNDEIFHPEGERPPTLEDRDASQTAVIFHPKTIQMVKFKADLLATRPIGGGPRSQTTATRTTKEARGALHGL